MFNNNDIGIEYCIHGLNIKNGTNRNADWLGRHYFKKALVECDDWRIWCNLGTAYFIQLEATH